MNPSNGFPLNEGDLNALDECVLAFAETCDMGDPNERAVRDRALGALERLSRAYLESLKSQRK